MSTQNSKLGHAPGERPLDQKDIQSDKVSDDKENRNANNKNDFSKEEYKPPIDFGPLKHVHWGETPLGEMHSWQPCLKSLTSLLVALPYAAAIFWGKDLIMIHNSPWEAMNSNLSGQGKRASELFGDEAVGRLRATMAGQVHDTESQNFFQNHGQEMQHLQTLLHPLCGDGNAIAGVMAQFMNSNDTSLKGFQKKQKSETPTKGEGKDNLETSDVAPDQTSITLSPSALIKWLHGAINKEDDYGSAQGTTGTDQGGRSDSSRMVQDLPIDGRVLFQKFAHMIPTGLAILDSDADALFVNDLFYKLTTHPGANPFRAWPQSIHPDDYARVMKEYRNAFHSDQILSTQFRSAGPGEYNAPSWRMFMMRPISDKAPIAQDGYICAIIDITSLKAAELYQKRIASEAIERKTQQEKFMDMISHEIRNPLSAILHCSESIIESLRSSPEGDDTINPEGVHSKDHIVNQECLGDIVEAAETILFCVAHQKNIVDDILSFSKLDAMMLSLSPSPFQPNQKFAQYLRIFQPEVREKRIEFKFAIDPSYTDAGIDWVSADMVRINQVLVNLITNAIKFTARKTGDRNITVSLGASYQRPTSYPPSLVFFKDEEAAHRMDATLSPEWGEGQIIYLLVAVRDTGIGISDENQARLFERFRQATPKTQEKYGGTGLGLFISRKICQLHGGDIGVSSKEGQGSTFGFFLKVRRAEKPAQQDIEKREAEMHNNTLVPESPPIDSSTPQSLINPPVEDRSEVHPAASSDERYERSAKIAAQVDQKMDEESESREQERLDEEERRKEWAGGENRTEGELERARDSFLSSSQPKQQKLESSQDRGSQEEQGSLNKGAAGGHDPAETQVDDKPGLSGNPSKPLQSPASEVRSVGQSGVKNIKPRTSPPPHVLLVEDNTVNQRVLKRHLQAKGFRVTTANNGQQAVEAHKARLDEQEKKDDKANEDESRATDAGQFDCILMDQEMPVMDGNTATKIIRQSEIERWGDAKRNRVPVLGISANARDVQREGMLSAGMDDVVSKPFSMADLVKHIHGMIERGSTTE